MNIQTSYQLISPLIPASIIDQIASPYWKISLGEGILFLISLWFYFLRKRIVVLVISSEAFFSYVSITRYFMDLIQ